MSYVQYGVRREEPGIPCKVLHNWPNGMQWASTPTRDITREDSCDMWCLPSCGSLGHPLGQQHILPYTKTVLGFPIGRSIDRTTLTAEYPRET